MKVATRLVFAECCWLAVSAIADVHYETSSAFVAAATSLLPDADYPKSWLGYQLGSISEYLHRLFGHRSFLHSLLALVLVTLALGPLLWWFFGRPAPALAVFVGYGSHLFADMMTLGGVQFFWPSRAIAVFPGRDEYRVVSGGNSERVFVALTLVFALLFYPVSQVGFDGLIHLMGGLRPALRHGDAGDRRRYRGRRDARTHHPSPTHRRGHPETVAPNEPVGCYGPEASEYTKQILYERQIDAEGEIIREGRLVRLEIPRIGDSEDAYGRTLAYVYVNTDGDGRYERLYNKDLITLGLARTTSFSHEHRREFERLREEAEERGAGLWGVCPRVDGY